MAVSVVSCCLAQGEIERVRSSLNAAETRRRESVAVETALPLSKESKTLRRRISRSSSTGEGAASETTAGVGPDTQQEQPYVGFVTLNSMMTAQMLARSGIESDRSLMYLSAAPEPRDVQWEVGGRASL